MFIAISYNCTHGQIRNNLSATDYNAIKINNINWKQISNTKGNISQMNTFFGNTFTTTTNTDPNLTIELWDDSKGIYFRFEDGSDTGNDYTMVNFEITNNNSNLTINNKTITIGSNINELGNAQINASGTDIVYGMETTDDILMIKFNSSTNLITSIEYTFFN